MFATAVRIERDLGVPSVSLNALAGHRSCAPEDCGGRFFISPQGPVPVTGVFPAGDRFHLLETRFQVIRLSPYRADLPARRPDTWARLPVFWHAIFPCILSDSGKPSDPEIISSHLCPLRGRYSSAPHGAPRVFSIDVSACQRRLPRRETLLASR